MLCSVLSTFDLVANDYCSMVYKSVHVYCPEFICQALSEVFFFSFLFQSINMNLHIILHSFSLSKLPVLIIFFCLGVMALG